MPTAPISQPRSDQTRAASVVHTSQPRSHLNFLENPGSKGDLGRCKRRWSSLGNTMRIKELRERWDNTNQSLIRFSRFDKIIYFRRHGKGPPRLHFEYPGLTPALCISYIQVSWRRKQSWDTSPFKGDWQIPQSRVGQALANAPP